MKSIFNVIKENRLRAIELCKLNNVSVFDLSEYDGDEIPYVLVDFGCGIIDSAVTKISMVDDTLLDGGKKFELEIEDLQNGETYTATEYDCIVGTENDVYMWIGEHFDDKVD